MSLLFGFIMAPQHHTSTFACRAVGENKPQKMNDFRRESFLLTHASTSRLSGFRVAKATRNLPAIRWLYVIYQYIRWVKKSTSFQFCAANLQKLFQTTIIPPPHFQIFLPPLSFKIAIQCPLLWRATKKQPRLLFFSKSRIKNNDHIGESEIPIRDGEGTNGRFFCSRSSKIWSNPKVNLF